MPFAHHFAGDHKCLELAANDGGAIGAHADQPDATGRDLLQSRNADIFLEASGADTLFVQGQEDGAAQRAAARRAAASASVRLE